MGAKRDIKMLLQLSREEKMLAWTSGSCKWLDLRDCIWLEYPKVPSDRLIMVAVGRKRDGRVGWAGEGKGGKLRKL